MLTKDEADRIADAITALRPDWNHAQVMAVLGDQRLRVQRTYRDATIAFVALALDAESRQPTRIFAHGPWWELLAPRVGSSVSYRTISNEDCAICSLPQETHALFVEHDDHEWEPQNARGKGAAPTPEQRAAIDAANAEARKAATKAREEAEAKKELATVDEVLARHQTEDEGSDEREERASA